MAKKASKVATLSINSVAFAGLTAEIGLDVSQETPEVTCLSDAGPRRVVGNYDFSYSVSGPADPASGNSEATLFALINNAGVAVAYRPTGQTPGANDPSYDGTALLESFSLKSATGQATTYSGKLVGGSALARTVA